LTWSNVTAGNYTLLAQAVYDGGSVMSSVPINISVPAPPSAASAPVPADGATDVALDAQLGWTAGWNEGLTAGSHDVYFGTRATPAFQGNQSGTTFDPGSLLDGTTYYWAVDEVTSGGTTAGPVWSFTTVGSSISIDFGSNTFSGGEPIGPLASDSSNWNQAGGGAAGTKTDLIDSAGLPTGTDIQWQSSNTWGNGDGTSDDQHRLAQRYLDDSEAVGLTISNIPYTAYKVYGLFATDQNGSGSCGIVNIDVNGTWALGGSASTTAAAWGGITANYASHGEYWTEIDPGSVQGNYWTMVTTGATCTVAGEGRIGSSDNRGCLTAIIIEKLQDTDGDGIPNDVDPDDDNDGIPDDWENAHGLDPLVDDANAHSDPDPYDNWFEYVTDTDPLDGDSWQTFSFEIDPGTGDPTARFSTSASRFYAVEFRDDLTSGNWDDLGSVFPGTGSETNVSDSAAGDQRYYRLRIRLP